MGTTLRFYIDKNKKRKKDGYLTIYLRVIHNLKKAEGKINMTPISEANFKAWNNDTQRFNSKESSLLGHNLLLNELQNQYHDFLKTNLLSLSDISPHAIRDYLLSRKANENVSVSFVANQYYMEVIFPDNEKAAGTKRNYKKSMNHLCSFLTHSKLEHLGIKDFKKIHASKFIDYLKTPIPLKNKIGMNNQSVNSILSNIKPLFNKLLFEEQILSNPFSGLSISFKKAQKPRITNQNFLDIINFDTKNHKILEVYIDIFSFLCYTGLSYCDMQNLKHFEVKMDKFDIMRKKSKVIASQFLIKPTKILLDKYKNLVPEDKILPQRSLDKLNLNLKLIGYIIGLDFPLTTYTARRFFRQSIYEAGINEGLIVKTLMGHSSQKDMDSHYLYVNDQLLKDAKKKLQKHFKKLLK
jgi:integrase